MRTAAGLLTLAVVAAVRWARRSGTTGASVFRALPGGELDRATTLPAPAERVWPWLVQLGKGRGGWYLPRRLELPVPPARRGLRRLDPRWLRLAVGDVTPTGAARTQRSRCAPVPVGRRGGPPMEISWALVRDPLDGNRCRLQLRLWIDLVDGVTVRPLFAGLAERVRTRRSTHTRWSCATVSKWWVIGKASNARIRSSW
jgi:hypothetical protein